MHDQPSNAVKEPEKEPHQHQIDLEVWQRKTGASRALGYNWEKGASGTLAQKIATVYLKQVLRVWEKSRHIPGRSAHIWDLMPGQKAVEMVALEALCFVLGNMSDDRKLNQLAATIGQRAELVLFLAHPTWNKMYHLQGLKLASNNDLGMKWMAKRFKAMKAIEYKPLRHAERVALGALLLEIMAEATGLISIDVKVLGRARRARMVSFTTLYWSFLARWKDAATMFRPLHMPMLVEPKDWTRFDDGGYLSIRTGISTVDWERWPEIIKRAKPGVMRSINHLQRQAFRIDDQQQALMEACWNLGHAIGSMPSQLRAEPPSEEYGNKEYWPQLYRYKASRRQDAARTRMVHSLVSYRRIELEERLWWVQYMDHRGRLYPRGSQINVQGPDHIRSLVTFDQKSPIKGHEPEFAWSLGEALGLAKDWSQRKQYLATMSTVIGRVGGDPLGNKGLWVDAKEPWRLIQLCKDWHFYLQDPGYQSGTIHWRDQTCSGWGHVACLTGDAQLARFTNVTGHRPMDLYTGLGSLIKERIKWLNENLDPTQERESRLRCIAWWRKAEIPRSLLKQMLMPIIYGRSHLSLSHSINAYLRDEVKDFLTDGNLRIVELSIVLAGVVNEVVKEAVPHARDLARWLGQVAVMQIDAGVRPYWFTPMGLAVESWSSDTVKRTVKLELSNRTVRVDLRDGTNQPMNKARSKTKLVPDFLHSMDAAFLQQFVSHWEAYRHPISTVHDCFGTTLEHVGTMRRELNDQWHRFYSTDWLSQHQAVMSERLGAEVPAPPLVGTLDRNEVGENPFLFC